MVFYFQPRQYGPGKDDYLIYMGKDKYENEDLIKYSLPQDIWFHVDDLSSAHVYLRLPEGITMDTIHQEALEDCIQLVKANSIQGNKQNNIYVIYTPAANLHKTPAMDVGSVSFKDDKIVKRVKIERRSNEIINRLNRTKKELYPDLEAEREEYDKEQRSKAKAEAQAQKSAEKSAKEQKKKEEDARSYKHVMREEDMITVKDMKEKYSTPEDYEEDFM